MKLLNRNSRSLSGRFNGWISLLQLVFFIFLYLSQSQLTKAASFQHFSKVFYLKSTLVAESVDKQGQKQPSPPPETNYLSATPTFQNEVAPKFVNQIWSYSELFYFDICYFQLKNIATQMYLNFSSAWIHSLNEDQRNQLYKKELSYQQVSTELVCNDFNSCQIWVHFYVIHHTIKTNPLLNDKSSFFHERKKGVVQYSSKLNEFVLVSIVSTNLAGNPHQNEPVDPLLCSDINGKGSFSPNSQPIIFSESSKPTTTTATTTTWFELEPFIPLAHSSREAPVKITVPLTPSTVCIHPDYPSFYSKWINYHGLDIEMTPPKPICTRTDLTWFDRKKNMLKNKMHPNIYIFVMNIGDRTWNPIWDKELKAAVRQMEPKASLPQYQTGLFTEYYHVFPHSIHQSEGRTLHMVPIAAPFNGFYNVHPELKRFMKNHDIELRNVMDNPKFTHLCLPSFSSLPPSTSLSLPSSVVEDEVILLFHRTLQPSLRRTVPVLPQLREVDVYLVCDGLDAEFRRFPYLENAAIHTGWTLHDIWTPAVEPLPDKTSTVLSSMASTLFNGATTHPSYESTGAYPLGLNSGSYLANEILRLAPQAKLIPVRIPSEEWDVMDLFQLIEDIAASAKKRSSTTTTTTTTTSSSFSSAPDSPRPSVVYLPLHFLEDQKKMIPFLIPTLTSVIKSLPYIAFVLSVPSWIIVEHGAHLGEVAMLVSRWDDEDTKQQLGKIHIPYHVYVPGKYIQAQPLYTTTTTSSTTSTTTTTTTLLESSKAAEETSLPRVIEVKSTAVAAARAVGVLTAHWSSVPFLTWQTPTAQEVMDFTMKVTWEPTQNVHFLHYLTSMCPNAQGPFQFKPDPTSKTYECYSLSYSPPIQPIEPVKKSELPVSKTFTSFPQEQPKFSNLLHQARPNPQFKDIPKQSEVCSNTLNSNTQAPEVKKNPSRSFMDFLFGGKKESHAYEL